MVTASLRKLVASLDQAKTRRETGLFVAEGTKCVLDTIDAFSCRHIIASPSWLTKHASRVASLPTVEATRADLERMTHFSTAPDVIAVYEIPQQTLSLDRCADQLTIALDRIQDPGNLGTIIRLADWFGISTIVCSSDTVDVYNPKVVQATMGAISRVDIVYTALPDFLTAMREKGVAVCGTFLDGVNIYAEPLPSPAVIVMGNEGAGISPDVAATVNRRLLIPSFPPEATTVESLNVAIATAITVAEFRRQSL
jgi:TrmH family RNA methyltransferase